MNTVSIGLQLLITKFKECSLSRDDAIDILKDVKSAADAALQLVSELLTHDKLEEGTMRLDTSPTELWALVRDTVRPFSSQVMQVYNI